MARGEVLIVTGTDTGVGKTRIARGVLRACSRAGVAVAPLKLVETGCRRVGSELLPEDGLALLAAARASDLAWVAPLRFELGAAPSVAARQVGRALTFSELASHVERAAAAAPRVLVEGAGGLLVPLGEEGSFADFARKIGARLLVVARDALGTLNHTLLTLEAAERRGLDVAAVVLNAASPEPCALDHAAELRALAPETTIVGPLPWRPAATDDELARELSEAGLPPARCFGGLSG